jgi:hypothetical protein
MTFGKDLDAWEATGPQHLITKEKVQKHSWMLSGPELKLMVIAGAHHTLRASSGWLPPRPVLSQQRTSKRALVHPSAPLPTR